MRTTLISCAAVLTLGCGEPAGPHSTSHTLSITASETWTLAESPHVVHGRLSVRGTLTIEAGATVLFADTSGLTFGKYGAGSLRAQGSASAPIVMRGMDTAGSPGAWIGLTFLGSTPSEMHHVSVSRCGRERTDSQPPGCLVLGSRFIPGDDPTLFIDHMTVQDAAGGAVILQRESRFGAGSEALSVRNVRGHIATLPAGETARFPLAGTFAGIDTSQVRLTHDTLRDSLTWARDIPWTVLDPVLIEGPHQPVLTIPAGATLLMKGGFIVGRNAPGGLQIGTEGGPTVTLRPVDESWGGVDFLPYAISSAISDALLDHCGANIEARGSGCVHIWGDYAGSGPVPAPVFKNVSIRDAVDIGVGLNYGGRFGAGSTNLTITGTNGTTGTPFFVHMSPLSSIPAGHYAGNLRDVIWTYQLEIRQDETWHKYDIPYFNYGGVWVGDSTTHPTLTVDPGVTMAFTGAGALSIGWTAPGAIRAVGTVADPVTFTGETDTPGSWTGIVIGPYADSSSVFDHVVVANGGAPYPVSGAFHFYVDIGAVIRNTVIRHSAGCGVIIVNQPPWSTDFTAPVLGNTFESNAGAAQCGP